MTPIERKKMRKKAKTISTYGVMLSDACNENNLAHLVWCASGLRRLAVKVEARATAIRLKEVEREGK